MDRGTQTSTDCGTQTTISDEFVEPFFDDGVSLPDSNDSAAVNQYVSGSYDPDQDFRFDASQHVQPDLGESRGYHLSSTQADSSTGLQFPIAPVTVSYFVTRAGQCIHKSGCHHGNRKDVSKMTVTFSQECLGGALKGPARTQYVLDWSNVTHESFGSLRFHRRDDGMFFRAKRMFTKCRQCM